MPQTLSYTEFVELLPRAMRNTRDIAEAMGYMERRGCHIVGKPNEPIVCNDDGSEELRD